jgi:hypothetical protein
MHPQSETGFALDEAAAQDLYLIFLKYVDSDPSGSLGVGQFITLVCDAKLDLYFTSSNQQSLFESSGGRLDFSGFLQTLGALATARYSSESVFSVAMTQLLQEHIFPLRGTVLDTNDTSSTNTSGTERTESSFVLRKVNILSREIEGQQNIAFEFLEEGVSPFSLKSDFLDPLRRVFSYYSECVGSAMRVATFDEIRRGSIVHRSNFSLLVSLFTDCKLMVSDRSDKEDPTYAMAEYLVKSIFEHVVDSSRGRNPDAKKSNSKTNHYGKGSKLHRSLRTLLSTERGDAVRNSSRRASVGGERDLKTVKSGINFHEFLVVLAHVAIYFESKMPKTGTDSWRTQFPLALDKVVQEYVLSHCYRQEPLVARLRTPAILCYGSDASMDDEFVKGLLGRRDVRRGFRALYFHYAYNSDKSLHRYTEAKSRISVLLQKEIPEQKNLRFWAETFEQVDGDGDGTLNLNQMCLALKRLGQTLNFFQAEDWMVRVGQPAGKELGVSFETFVAGWGVNFDLSNGQKQTCRGKVLNRFTGLTVSRALQFAKDFEIFPTLLSEGECRAIYSQVTSSKDFVPFHERSYGMGVSSGGRLERWRLSAIENAVAIDCEHFVAFVCQMSQRALEKYPFDTKQSSCGEKLLMMLWRIEYSKKGKYALAMHSRNSIFGALPNSAPDGRERNITNNIEERESVTRTLGIRPEMWGKVRKNSERVMWASMAASRSPKRNVSSEAEGDKKKTVRRRKAVNRNKAKCDENLSEAMKRRNAGKTWSSRGYSLETVRFRKNSSTTADMDESVFHHRGSYMGRHWQKNKARARPAQNRHRFMKSLTSHGLRSSGSRKDARNATVRRNENFVIENAPEHFQRVVQEPIDDSFDEADNGNVEKLDDAQNISDQSWDDEVAGELAKLRAELSAATANN